MTAFPPPSARPGLFQDVPPTPTEAFSPSQLPLSPPPELFSGDSPLLLIPSTGAESLPSARHCAELKGVQENTDNIEILDTFGDFLGETA